MLSRSRWNTPRLISRLLMATFSFSLVAGVAADLTHINSELTSMRQCFELRERLELLLFDKLAQTCVSFVLHSSQVSVSFDASLKIADYRRMRSGFGCDSGRRDCREEYPDVYHRTLTHIPRSLQHSGRLRTIAAVWRWRFQMTASCRHLPRKSRDAPRCCYGLLPVHCSRLRRRGNGSVTITFC